LRSATNFVALFRMKKILALILFPFFLNAQREISKDSILEKNTSIASRTKEEARELIENIRQRVIKGEDFKILAEKYSEDPGSARQGGMLQAFKQGKMVPEFEVVAFSLKSGEISDIFETQYGFHFLQVLAREGESVVARHILIKTK
jgi:peptidyl-prolyl cis-trans isomerase SurA